MPASELMASGVSRDDAGAHSNPTLSTSGVICYRVQVENTSPASANDPRSLATYLANGEVENAIHLLRTRVDAHPDDASALIQLGELLRHTPDIIAGVEFLRRGVKISPTNEIGWLSLASALKSLSQNEGAKAAFREVLELNESRIEALNDLGTILMDEGDWSSAIALFQQASNLSPETMGIRINLARALAQDGRTTEALATAQSVLSSSPDGSVEASKLIAEITRPIGAGEMASSLANPHYNIKAVGLDQ